MKLLSTNEMCSSLTVGDLVFKSRTYGEGTNFISLSLTVADTLTLTVQQEQNGSAFLYEGSGIGVLSAIVFFGSISETFTIISTSSKLFNVVGSVSGNLGIANVGKVFRSNQIVFLIRQNTFNIGDKFTVIKAISESFSALDIASLRLAVASSKFIWMPEPLLPVDPLAVAAVAAFPKTCMIGGSGLPLFPLTDLPLPMAFVNYRETIAGKITVATVYTWVGTQFNGKWVAN